MSEQRGNRNLVPVLKIANAIIAPKFEKKGNC